MPPKSAVPDELTSSFLAQATADRFPWLDVDRARQILAATGIPRLREERWKHTNPHTIVSAFAPPVAESNEDQRPYAVDGNVAIHSFNDQPASEFCKKWLGRVNDYKQYPLCAVNALTFSQGYLVEAKASECQPARVAIASSHSNCQRFLIIVEAGASLEIVENCGGENRVFESIVQEGGSLIHRRFQSASDEIEYSHIASRIDASANYSFVQYSAGAKLRRNEVVVDMVGKNANASLSGGWRVQGRSHLDTYISVNHECEQATSRQKFHGTVHDRARAVFNGRIYIAKDAQQTDAQLTNRNILASSEAEVYTKPELEIYANDVVCAHGATTGQLDEDQLFYLRSRGIADEAARQLLIKGFLREIVEHERGADVLDIKDAA